MDSFERAAARDLDKPMVGWRIHFAIYVAIQLMLVAIWALTWSGRGVAFPWFIFPMFGWGSGVVAHYLGARSATKRAG